MNKLLTAFALASVLLSGAAQARDYMDKTETSCAKDDIEDELASLISSSPAGKMYGIRLLYIKGEPVEVSRKSTELRCRVTAVTSRSTNTGIFNYVNEDGHNLISWDPTKKR